MPELHFLAKLFDCFCWAVDSIWSRVPAPRPTPLPQQPPPTPRLSTAPTPPPALPNPEPQNPAPPTSSPSILPPTASSPLQHAHAHDFVLSNPQFNHFSPSPTILAPTASSPPQHVHAHEMFHNAHHLVFNGSQFNESSPAGSGIERLLSHSMPDAFHNSSARYPPPKCHLGTRKDYIALVTDWVLGVSDRKEPILWMRGPFGVGKSAVAQSCAEGLEPINKLAAALFFSHSNADSQRVFASVAYQVAAICPSFWEIVDKRMINDPALVTKSLPTQFKDLLVHPLDKVDTAGNGLDGRVVIIDGLDECRGTAAQREIIEIIAASARNRTTPFRWFITSRPEDAIIRTMNSAAVSPVCSRIELPVSRAIDHEILTYLTDEFKKIQKSYSLPKSWPSEEALALLVKHGAGLWIYVATMVRFIKDENSYGPKDQLQIVLRFIKDVSTKAGMDNPLAEMDFFYTLIMQRTSLKLRTMVLKILLIHSFDNWSPTHIANVLQLSAEQLRHACASIQSVMELQGSDLGHTNMNLYHASFLDFMKDPLRSKELCIYGDLLVQWRQELLVWLHEVCSCSTGSSHIVSSPDTTPQEDELHTYHYSLVLVCFWRLCEVPTDQLDPQTAMSVVELPFNKMLRLVYDGFRWPINATRVRNDLPAELCDKIIRRGKCPISGCTNTENVWILGHGENESVPRQRGDVFWVARNNDPPGGVCICQAGYW
ncbi:hypothetical protein D9756_009878 [Leucocoprinus leucothites]|uniref:Nephrocystin 3-like N-terminal domain-containing protein n=1 Tax=Leucocoprinus leucothites TaxID=201217 RepID=A0A8H5CSQ4_9AGAR|nr:hypothetical protein D9756_009878 [Leucoagaricus leucothites]